MLSELSIEGYKPFRDPQRMRMAPLTFIYGPNSAGKSSVIEAVRILLAKNQFTGDVPGLENDGGDPVDLFWSTGSNDYGGEVDKILIEGKACLNNPKARFQYPIVISRSLESHCATQPVIDRQFPDLYLSNKREPEITRRDFKVSGEYLHGLTVYDAIEESLKTYLEGAEGNVFDEHGESVDPELIRIEYYGKDNSENDDFGTGYFEPRLKRPINAMWIESRPGYFQIDPNVCRKIKTWILKEIEETGQENWNPWHPICSAFGQVGSTVGLHPIKKLQQFFNDLECLEFDRDNFKFSFSQTLNTDSKEVLDEAIYKSYLYALQKNEFDELDELDEDNFDREMLCPAEVNNMSLSGWFVCLLQRDPLHFEKYKNVALQYEEMNPVPGQIFNDNVIMDPDVSEIEVGEPIEMEEDESEDSETKERRIVSSWVAQLLPLAMCESRSRYFIDEDDSYEVSAVEAVRNEGKNFYSLSEFITDWPSILTDKKIYTGEQVNKILENVSRSISQSLNDLKLPYQFKLQTTNKQNVGYGVEILFQKNGATNWVTLRHVGTGIGQVIPVLLATESQGESIAEMSLLRQPELHLHPRQQADLAEILVQKSKVRQIVCETHSEMFIARIQRLIRRGELAPSEVSVLYVDPIGVSSQVKELRLRSDGDFIDEWPGGFFEDAFDEYFSDDMLEDTPEE